MKNAELDVLKVNKQVASLHFSQMVMKSFVISQKGTNLSTGGPHSEARGKRLP